jgi:TRAP-type C4-dicarboxylate transport system substrate-binding protein
MTMARPSLNRIPLLSRRRLTAGLVAALALPAGSARAQAVDWTMATEYPASSMSGEGLRLFAEALARESGGRISAWPFYDAASGFKSADMVAAVRDGKLAVGDAFGGALGKVDPLFLLSSLPFVAVTYDDAKRLSLAARGAYQARFLKERQRLLYVAPWPASGLWVRKPIMTPADIKGLRLRVYDSTGVEVFTGAGAAPVTLSFADTMPKLKDGSIEAVLSSGDGGAGRSLWEYLNRFIEIGYAVPLSFTTLRGELYDGLSPDLRAAVDRAAAQTEAQLWTLLETRGDANYARMANNGVIITKAQSISPELRALLAQSGARSVESWKREAGAEASTILATIGR